MAPTHVVVNTADGTVQACPDGTLIPFATAEAAQAVADEHNGRTPEQYRTRAVYALVLVTLGPADEPAFTVDSVMADRSQHEVVGLADASKSLGVLGKYLHTLGPGESVSIARLVTASDEAAS